MAVIDFNVDPYYDDYEGTGGAKSKKYHRVLFRPGFPVQARELTQLQTILQNQVERFGRHIFEEGSMVIPGDIAFDSEYDFIKVQSTFNAQNVESYRTDFVNKIITGSETGVKARVIGTLAATSTTPLTLYVKYEDSGTNNATNTFKIGETILSANADNTVAKNPKLTTDQTTEISATLLTTGTNNTAKLVDRNNAGDVITAGESDTVGRGSAVQIQAGVYFVNGFFVANDAQTILLDKYSPYPSYRVGFQVTQSTTTPEEDETLKDNAQGSSNYAAPGAHRYKINLTLVKKELTATDDTDFIELVRVKNGNIAKLVKKADYNYLQEEFARRTFDESGDYEVKPFKLDVREHLLSGSNRGIYTASTTPVGDANKLALGIEPGKAYVQGYELETQITKFIDAPKPRTFNRVVDTPIQTPIGNHVLVQNVKSMPDIDDFEELHIYDDLRSGSGVSIGTCNVRAFALHDGDYSGTLATKTFKLGIFDIQMNDGKDFARHARAIGDNASPGSAVFIADIKPKLVPLTGTASNAASGATTTTGQGSLFLSEVIIGDRIFINDVDIGEVTSVPNNLSLGTTAFSGSAVTAGQIKRFSAEIIRPDRKTLVFPTGYFRMRKIRGSDADNPDNVNSSVYLVRRKFTAKAIAANTVQFTVAGLLEEFNSSAVTDYVMTIATPAGGSARAVGDILDISSSNIALSNSNRTATFSNLNGLSTSPITNGDTVDLIATIKVKGTDGVEKTKTLNVNETHTVSTAGAAQQSTVKLNHADGFRLISVHMAPDFSTSPTTSHQNITSRYDFDTGMRDAYYDLAAIKLKSGRPAPTGQILITFDYFGHGGGDYFSVDSYDGVVDYEDIPTFKSPDTGTVLDLRDCLDFRPRIDNNGVNFTSAGSSSPEIPHFDTSFDADFSYYLGRIDKVVINFDGQMKLVQGVPDINPIPPLDLAKAMTLFEVTYSPYVLNTDEVIAKKLNNRRYTMKDIGRLDKRIANLEEITSLTLLEKATTDLLVKDVDGNDRLKNGFIVDNFTGHGIGNVASEDYRIAVDMKRRVARPMGHEEIVRMVEANNSDAQRTSAFYKKHKDGVITLNYSEQVHIQNPYATDSMEVNAYKVAAFTGELDLIPASDDWKDTTRRPDLVVVDDNNYDAIKFLADEIGVEGTVWEGWQDTWFGEQVWTGERNLGQQIQGQNIGNVLQQVGTQQVGQVNIGVQTTLMNEQVDKSLGDKIVDLSMIPFMREIPIHMIATNMKPRTRVNAFFDNEDVNAFIKPDDKLTVTSTNRTDFNFFPLQDPGSYADSDDARTFGSMTNPLTNTAQPVAAFAVGDVIKNVAHTAVSISAIAQVGNTTTITVSSVNGIKVGHIVEFTNIAGSTELNKVGDEFKYYFVESVDTSANTFTIVNADLTGSPVSAITAYTSGGTCQRIQASAVVTYQGPDSTENANGLPIVIHIANRKGGFAIDDELTGSIDNANGVKNQCTISAINGVSTATSTDVYKNLKKFGDTKITDDDGVFTGVFVVPNTDTIKFRTGERTLRLIDNNSNSVSTGVHTTKAEKIFAATGINETREETILSLRQANFVRDRVQDDREVTRNITGSTRFQVTGTIQPQGDNGDSGDGGGNSWGGHDPLAQTFVISECQDGIMMTKMDLFFDTAGTRPILIQIVNTKDGFPGQKILAQTTIPVASVNTSADASAATTVTFDSPVFLAQDVTYAVLVKVDEPGCKVYYSELGGVNIGDNRIVSRNPLTGTMFLSQNGGTWTPHQTRDIKMTLHRADFTPEASTIEFNNVRNGFTTLQTDPFETAPNTNQVRVTQRNHGFREGDTVVIDGVAAGFYGANSTTNGIPHTELNGTHTIPTGVPITNDTYIIQVTSSNVVGGISGLSADFSGGANIQARRNIVADIIQPSITNIRFADTTLSYDMNITNTAKSFSGYIPVPDNGNVYQTTRKFVFSVDNQPATQGYSAQLKASMQTTNRFVSPMIDSQRISLCMIANRVDNLVETDVNVSAFDDRTVATGTTIATNTSGVITTTDAATRALFDTVDIGKYITASGFSNATNNVKYLITNYANDGTTATISVSPAPAVTESASASVTLTQHEKFLHDIAPKGATNAANYLTRRFTLENPSTAIKILYEMNRPNGALMDVYFKVLRDGSEKAFDDIPYTLTTTEIPDTTDESENVFRERTHLVENLDEFSTIAVKFVFKSTTLCAVPKIKNLRVIALAL